MVQVPAFRRHGRGQAMSAGIEEKLIDTLFVQPRTILAGAIGLVGCTIFCWAWSRELWLLVASGTFFILAIARFRLGTLYNRRSGRAHPMVWAKLFALGGASNSFVLGIASSIAILTADASVQMVILTAQGAYVTVSAVRNNAVAFVALLQVVPPFVLSIAASLASGSPFYMIYAFFILIHLATTLEIAGFLRQKTCDLLIADERAAAALSDLAAANRRLETMAITDGLTGAVNRRGFDTALAQACEVARRERQAFSLLLLDIDHFKSLNDRLGHQAGDACLQQIAACLRDNVRRPAAVVARYGGEEFAIILPQTLQGEAGLVAEQVRIAVQAKGLFHPAGAAGVVTISIGHATSDTATADAAALLKLADAALYRAKLAGRNQVMAGSPPPVDSLPAAA